jgi:uncharacterized RDD family membrane protein YckC
MNTKYAGFWIRLVADIIDSIVLNVAMWLVQYSLLGIFYLVWKAYLTSHGQAVPGFSDAFNAFWIQMFGLGLLAVISFPYYVWGHFRYGTTLGKRVFRIYVVDYASQNQMSLKQSIIRFFSYGLSYIVFATGFIMAGFHPKKRALHDLLAGTISIIKPKEKEATAAPSETPQG